MPDIWTLEQPTARLDLPRLKARLDLQHPEHGLHALDFRQQPLAATVELLGVDLAPASAPTEAYGRQGDLVVSYPGTAEGPLAVQVYWRVNPEETTGRVEIDLEVSVQTPRLDSDPALSTASQLPAAQTLRLVDDQMAEFRVLMSAVSSEQAVGDPRLPGCWLLRPAGQAWSYAEMVHPADLNTSEISLCEQGYRLRHRLFVSRLEKGVILRARVRGVLLVREDDCALAAAAYHRFVQSPPPLTT
ncbi:MAG TPA: hypothetical protein VIK18_17345 [Pirellulales bacterium]